MIKTLHRIEDFLLVVLLSAMIVLASTQILLRNFLDTGLVWVDPLLRVMVLWLGLVGASVACRNNKHIRIDLLSRFIKGRMHLVIEAFVSIFSASICLVIAWFGFHWVGLDYSDGTTSFAGIPAWILEIIIPFSFALIGARYLLSGFNCLFRLRIQIKSARGDIV